MQIVRKAWRRISAPIHEASGQLAFANQLRIVLGAVIILLGICSSVMDTWEARRRLEFHFAEQGKQSALYLAKAAHLATVYGDRDGAGKAARELLKLPDARYVEILDATGKLLTRTYAPGVKIEDAPYQLAGLVSDPDRPTWTRYPAQNNEVLVENLPNEWLWTTAMTSEGVDADSPFSAPRAPTLVGYARISIGKGTLQKLVTSLWLGNIAVSLAFATILFGLLHLLTQHLSRPLKHLANTMRRAKAGETGLRAPTKGPRDIAEMASVFNEMMTVLEQREAELKASRDEALKTAMLRTQFAATVGHEVRTPLNGVIGVLDMLRETELTPRQQDYVDLAWRSSRTLNGLINDILDFSKVDAGKMELDEVEFDLRRLIEEVIELLGRQAAHKALDIGYLLMPGVPAMVVGDALRIRQVLTNLCNNALKFTEYGEVGITVSSKLTQHGIQLNFEIRDTGVGMTPEEAAQVFESYKQASKSTQRKFGGTGLGLTICKQLVTLMGGQIQLVTEPGKGSTFSFDVQCHPARTTPESLDDRRLKGVRVLICNNASIVRNFVVQSLNGSGVRCGTVLNLGGALGELQRAAASGDPYNVLAIDSGGDKPMEFIRLVRNDPMLSGLKILAFDHFHGATQIRPWGADLYLHKPLRVKSLVEGVYRLRFGEVAVPQPESASLPSLKQPSSDKQFRVLVVDDNATNRVVATGLLELNGCEVDQASNGLEAVFAARSKRYDMILMDCSMPVMDGYEATARIRSHELTLGRRIPIIAMMAADRSAFDKCAAAGMDDFLSKPTPLEEMRLIVQRWLAPLLRQHDPVDVSHNG